MRKVETSGFIDSWLIPFVLYQPSPPYEGYLRHVFVIGPRNPFGFKPDKGRKEGWKDLWRCYYEPPFYNTSDTYFIYPSYNNCQGKNMKTLEIVVIVSILSACFSHEKIVGFLEKI